MKKQKKILIICPYPQNTAPSQRLKYEQYFEHFKKNGYDITVAPFMHQNLWQIVYKKGNFFKKLLYTIWGYWQRFLLLLTVGRYDIVYVHLWATPFGLPLYESILCLLSKKIVYDIDDMIFLGRSSKYQQWTQFFKGKLKIVYLIKHSGKVIVSTTALQNFAQYYNNRVYLIPCTINSHNYPYVYKPYDGGTFIIGWMGSHSTSHYLKLIEKQLYGLTLKNIPFEVWIVGDTEFKFDVDIPYKTFPWSEHTELEFLSRMHVGIYPLPNDPWIMGKSGGKLRQYMSCGIPPIATDTPVNREIIENGVNGILIPFDNPDSWTDVIEDLFKNPDKLMQLSQNARKTIESKYSTDVYAPVYLSVLND